jgi:hypothetical protein
MAGLIDSVVPAIQNPLLRQVAERIETNVGGGQGREDYLKIVVAGMRAAIGGPKPMLANLKGRPDPVKDCAVGAVNLVLFLRNLSKGTMPPVAMIMATMTLMLQALDFADQAGIVKVGEKELDRATHIFTNMIFPALGISPEMLNKAAGQVNGLTQDPAKLEAIKKMMPQGQAEAPVPAAAPAEEA